MLTKQQIETCNDGQQLADWAAEYCRHWKLCKTQGFIPFWGFPREIDPHIKPIMAKEDWQPHQPTEKGKAQAIDLAVKYEMALDFEDLEITLNVRPYEQHDRWETVFFGHREIPQITWQIAVLKAALLSEIGE